MTRINANIKPAQLIDQHLIAEYREIIRIPNAYHKNPQTYLNSIKRAPKSFVLGTGHVLYFYDKLEYLHQRFLLLKQEMVIREIVNNIDDSMFLNLPDNLYNCITDNDELNNASELVKQRIVERITTMKNKPKYYGKIITLAEYLNIYDENK